MSSISLKDRVFGSFSVMCFLQRNRILPLGRGFAVGGLGRGFQKPHVVAEVDELEALGDAPFDFGGVLDRDTAGFASFDAADAESLQGGLVIGVASGDAHGHG